MLLPTCFFDDHGAFTLGGCKPLGLSFSDWATFAGVSVLALLAWLARSIILPIIKFPIKYVRSRIERRSWPLVSNEHGHTSRKMIGREGVLERLREILIAGTPAVLTNSRAGVAAVRGQGGVGKTFTAISYIARYRNQYKTVWQVPADTPDALYTNLLQLGRKIGVDDISSDNPKNAAIEILHELAAKGKPALILFDNVTTPAEIRPFIIEPGSIHYLITSRHDDWTSVASDLRIGVLKPEAALELLKRESSRDSLDLRELINALDCLPLAIVVAGAYLRTNPSISVPDYIGVFSDRLHDAPTNDDYDKSIYAAVMTSYDRLSPETQELANFCSLLAPNDPDILFSIDRRRGERVSLLDIISDKPRLSEMFANLRSVGLVERINGHSPHRMHRLTQAVLRQYLRDRGRHKQWLLAIIEFLASLMPGDIAADPEVWDKCARLMPHVFSLKTEMLETVEAPNSVFHVLFGSCSYLFVRGHFDGSRELSEELRAFTAKTYGGETSEYAQVLNVIAGNQMKLRDFKEARDASEEAHRVVSAIYSSKHPIHVQSLANLAQTYRQLGEKDQALSLLVQSRLAMTEIAGEESLSAALAALNLSVGYSSVGQMEDAKRLNEIALSVARKVVGELHWVTETAYHNLSIRYSEEGDFEQAIECSSKSVGINMMLGVAQDLLNSRVQYHAHLLRSASRKRALRQLKRKGLKYFGSIAEALAQEHGRGATDRWRRDAEIVAYIRELGDRNQVEVGYWIQAIDRKQVTAEGALIQVKGEIEERRA